MWYTLYNNKLVSQPNRNKLLFFNCGFGLSLSQQQTPRVFFHLQDSSIKGKRMWEQVSVIRFWVKHGIIRGNFSDLNNQKDPQKAHSTGAYKSVWKIMRIINFIQHYISQTASLRLKKKIDNALSRCWLTFKVQQQLIKEAPSWGFSAPLELPAQLWVGDS